jgi:hypothetical protein
MLLKSENKNETQLTQTSPGVTLFDIQASMELPAYGV